jgi:capsular exopolysaccharide synthesis family protein
MAKSPDDWQIKSLEDLSPSIADPPQVSPQSSLGSVDPLPGQPRETVTQDNPLRQVWFSLKHRGPLVLAVAVACTTVAGIWIWRQTPLYQGRFRLLMGSSVPQPTVNSSTLAGGDVGQLDVATQIAVLQSDQVLAPIIKGLQTQYPTLNYEALMGVKPSSFLPVSPPLMISQWPGTQIIEVTYLHGDRPQIEAVLEKLSQGYLNYSLAERKGRIDQGISFIDAQLSSLQNQINARQTKLSDFQRKHNLLDPSLRSQELSAQFSAIQSQYLATDVSLREIISLYQTLQSQLNINPQQAIALNALVQSPRYQGLLAQLQQVEGQLALQSTRSRQDSTNLQLLRQKRDRLVPLLRQTAQSILGSQFTPQNAKDALNQSGGLQLNLNQQYIQTANQLIVFQAKKAALAQQLTALQKQIQAMPVLAKQYVDLQRNVDLATDSLNRFLEAKTRLQIESAQQIPPWQLISPPQIGDRPVWPQPLKALSLAFVTGLLLGTLAALFWERFNPVFHSLEDIKKAIPLPVLGKIPWQKDLQRVEDVLGVNLAPLISTETDPKPNGSVRGKRPNSQSPGFLEAFRNLNTNLGLLEADQSLRSLVIASAQVGEGKSTVAFHLAQASAAMGKRVLLVDGNLRHPQIHYLFGLLNNQGLSNILTTGIAPEKVIQRVPQWENLSILTAGDLPPDPMRLLTSQNMQTLMATWATSPVYDLVIYDTPALGDFSDARIMGAASAGLIFVVKPEQTNRTVLTQVLTALHLSQVPLLGLIANGVNPHENGSNLRYEGYGYAKR